MNVLVTGAYGYVGRNICKLLSNNGAHVFGIGHGDWVSTEYEKYGIKSWTNSHVTLDALANLSVPPDIIIHCAGGSSVQASVIQPISDFTSTVSSTYAVLEFIRTRVPKTKLVYPSSAAVYGCATKFPISENDAINPVSPYGLHKLFSEQLCRSYAISYSLNIAIVRLFSIYGPGLKKQLMWDACQRLSRGDYLFFGTGEETRDWLHIEDATSLLLLAATYANVDCPTINGGSGVATTNRDMLQQLAGFLGESPIPQFNLQNRPGDPLYYHADISTARSWGWQPRIPLVNGIAEYVKWFKDETR